MTRLARCAIVLLAVAVCGCQALAGFSSGSAHDGGPLGGDADAAVDGKLDGDAADATDDGVADSDASACSSSQQCTAAGSACVNGQCALWWNSGWRYRRRIVLFNRASTVLPAGTTVAVVVDTRALFAHTDKKLAADCSDLRVVHAAPDGSYTELPRHVDTPSGPGCDASDVAEIYFQLHEKLDPGGATARHYLYYGNSAAPTTSPSSLLPFKASSANATLVCPFRGTLECAGGSPTQSRGSILHFAGGSALLLDGTDDAVEINLADSTGAAPPQGQGSIELYFMLVEDLALTQAAMGLFGSDSAASTAPRLSFEKQQLFFRLGGITLASGALTLRADSWHYAHVRWDGSALSLILDGTERDRVAFSGDVLANAGSKLIFGRNADGLFRGLIDEVRLSSRTRAVNNVSVLQQQPRYEPDSATEVLLHFDEQGSDPRLPQQALDASRHGRSGRLVGAPRFVSGRSLKPPFAQSSWAISQRQPFASHGGVNVQSEYINRVPNPSFETNSLLPDWQASQLSASIRASGGLFGAQLVSLKTTVAGTSGRLTTFATTASAEGVLTFFARRRDHGVLSAAQVVPIVRGIAQTAANTRYEYVGGGWWRITSPGSLQVADSYGVEVTAADIDVDGVMVGTPNETYVDGTLGAPTYRWDANCDPTNTESSPAHASCSVRVGLTGRSQTQMLSYDNASASKLAPNGGAISLWFKPRFDISSAGQVGGTLLQAGYGSGFGLGFDLRINGPSLELHPFNAAADPPPKLDISGVKAGEWQHVVASWDGQQALLYHNAVGSAAQPFVATSIDSELHVGGGRGSASPAKSVIADLRLFDGPLSAGDVTNLYHASLVAQRLSAEQEAVP